MSVSRSHLDYRRDDVSSDCFHFGGEGVVWRSKIATAGLASVPLVILFYLQLLPDFILYVVCGDTCFDVFSPRVCCFFRYLVHIEVAWNFGMSWDPVDFN